LAVALIRGGQQRIHLIFFQVGHRGLWSPLCLDCPYLSTPLQMLGTAQADEVGQGMDRPQALVPGRDSAASIILQIAKEDTNTLSGDIFDSQPIDCDAGETSDRRQKLTQGALRSAICNT
jgi:hypothetical protein